MKLEFIEGLVRLAEASRLTEIDYSENGARIRILRNADGSVSVKHGPEAENRHDGDRSTESSSRHRIAAGLSGMVYRSPSPGAPPFVEVGDRVEEGQTLGIIEAMKMLSPIEADRAGSIAEICVADATLVEVGTPLFVITDA